MIVSSLALLPAHSSAISSGSSWDGYIPASDARLNQTLSTSVLDESTGLEFALVANLWSLQQGSTSDYWDYGIVVSAVANSRHIIDYQAQLGGRYPCKTNTWIGGQLPFSKVLGDNEGFFIGTQALPFWYYGAWYYNLWVTENGWLTFDPRALNDNGGKWTSPTPPSAFPTTNDGRADAIIAPMWKDFHGGTVRWGVYGLYLVIAWDGVMDTTGKKQYFMVQLHLTRATDDRIYSDLFFNYCSVTNTKGALVGMEDQAGKRGENAGLPSSQTLDWFDAGTTKEPKLSVWTGIKSIRVTAHEYYHEFSSTYGYDPDASIAIVNVDDIPPEPGGINIDAIPNTQGAYVPPAESGKFFKTGQVMQDVLGVAPFVGEFLSVTGFAMDAIDAWKAWTETPPDKSSWQEVGFDSSQSTAFFRGAANEANLPDGFPWNANVFSIGLQPVIHWTLRNPDSVANRDKVHFLDLIADIEIVPWSCTSNCKSVIVTQAITLTLRPGRDPSNAVQYFEWFGRTNPDRHTYNIRSLSSYELQGSGMSSGYHLESAANGDTGYKMLAWSTLSRDHDQQYQLDGSGRLYVDGFFKQLGPTTTPVNLYVIGSYYDRPPGTPHYDNLDNIVGTFSLLTSTDAVGSWVHVTKQIDMGPAWADVPVKLGIGRTVDQANTVQAVEWAGVRFSQSEPQCRLTVTYGTPGGTTTPIAGQYSYACGATQQDVQPNPANGYRLDYWVVDGDVYSGNFVVVTMDRDHSVAAYFTNLFPVTVYGADPADSGSSSPAAGTYLRAYGSTFSATAYPGSGYAFDYWSEASHYATYFTPSISPIVDGNLYLQPHFKTNADLTITVSGNGGTTNPSPGTWTYGGGTVVSVQASPYAYYSFDHWTLDGVTGTENPISVTMDANHALVAYFVPYCDLTITAGAGGTTNPAPGTYPYIPWTVVSVQASPYANYAFGHWTLNGITRTENPVSVTMDTNYQLVAYFTPYPALTITAGAGGTTSPAPGTYYYAPYVPPTVVSVTALPNAHYVFDHWTLDGVTRPGNPISVTMDANHALAAYFVPTYTLTITAGAGGTTNPAPGTYTYTSGTVVSVTALPNAGYVFDHWTLDGVIRTGNPISVTMGANHALAAYFVLGYTLTITAGGGGTTNPAPGSYGYAAGTVVTVQASPSSGFVWGYWTLDGNKRTENPISVTMGANHALVANFGHTLTITAGTGGTTSPPPGTHIYDPWTVVRVTASPNAGYVFDHWTLNGVTWTGTWIDVTMDQNYQLVAYFRITGSGPRVSSEAGGPGTLPSRAYAHATDASLELITGLAVVSLGARPVEG